jgi:hypothetical protein
MNSLYDHMICLKPTLSIYMAYTKYRISYGNLCEVIDHPFTMFTHIYNAICNGDMLYMEYIHFHHIKFDAEFSNIAAKYGHLDCLQYVAEQGSHLTVETMMEASTNGHLNCMIYLRNNGCPWNDTVCFWAARNGHTDCLRYALEEGCPCYEDDREHYWACLKYLDHT